jgi:hypothetical protein
MEYAAGAILVSMLLFVATAFLTAPVAILLLLVRNRIAARTTCLVMAMSYTAAATFNLWLGKYSHLLEFTSPSPIEVAADAALVAACGMTGFAIGRVIAPADAPRARAFVKLYLLVLVSTLALLLYRSYAVEEPAGLAAVSADISEALVELFFFLAIVLFAWWAWPKAARLWRAQ